MKRLAYRQYRKLKLFFLDRKPDVLSRLFFEAQERAGRRLSARNKESAESRDIWIATYRQRFGDRVQYQLEIDQPVASDSADHKWPRGTLYDNSTNPSFNRKLAAFFGGWRALKVLDLGCAGGGFVRSLLEDGSEAVGIEGSDISKRLQSGEWATCPHHLFTGDITSRFQVRDLAGKPVDFHCITAWEVMEHIPTEKLPILFDNVTRHLKPNGIFVASIDTLPDGNPVKGAVYHLTVKPKEWWLDKFAEHGLVPVPHPFDTPDFVRGHGKGLLDWSPEDGDGFHVVMRRV